MLKLTPWRHQAWKYFPLNLPIRKAIKSLSKLLLNKKHQEKIRTILKKAKS